MTSISVGEQKALTEINSRSLWIQFKITTQVTLTLPEDGGPFPVLIGGGSWSASLIRRGYAACEFPFSVDQATNRQELHPGWLAASWNEVQAAQENGRPSR